MLKIGIIAAALSAFAAVANGAEQLPYLYDQMKKPAYAKPLESLLQGRRVPSWIGGFLRGGNGVATPGAAAAADGKVFELYAVCEPHNCGGNFLYVLYPPQGGRAWALVTKDDAVLAFFGNPTAGQRSALLAARSQ